MFNSETFKYIIILSCIIMRKLTYTVDLKHFKSIKKDVVPAIFTEHQFKLIEKRFSGKSMSQSEKNEFSRAISRKMNALQKIIQADENSIYVYGKSKMIKSRLELAKSYLKDFSRRFKNRNIIISGSFLHSNEHKDIDIFVVSRYEKEDYNDSKFHINYLQEDAYGSLFFASLSKLCISNKPVSEYLIDEKVSVNTLISLYQELSNDLYSKNIGISHYTLRRFLIQSAYLSNNPVPDSLELKKMVDSILSIRRPFNIISSILANTIVVCCKRRKAINTAKTMIFSYKKLARQYPQHKYVYQDIIRGFEMVISIES